MESEKAEPKPRAETFKLEDGTEIMPGAAKAREDGNSSRGSKFKAKKVKEEVSEARKRAVAELANEMNAVILMAFNSKIPLEQRQEAAAMMLAKCSALISTKYLMKVEPWAEEICAGLSMLTMGVLMAAGMLQTEVRNVVGKDQPGKQAATAGPAGTGKDDAAKGSS